MAYNPAAKGRDVLIRKMIKQGMSKHEIATATGLSLNALVNYCKYHNIALPKKLIQKGIYKVGNNWTARVYCKKDWFHIGTYETRERAFIASQLWLHWYNKGYEARKIPVRPRTRDAI